MRGRQRLIAGLLGVLVLLAMGVQQGSAPGGAVAEAYHARVRAAVDAVPTRIGDWAGHDGPVAEAAMDLLQPNAILSRQYRNLRTGESVGLLIVHCRDARDMVNHYPPICYVASGWTADGAAEVAWPGIVKPGDGRRYGFRMIRQGMLKQLSVWNLLLVPPGRFAHGMDEVAQVAARRTTRPFGAGQVQIVFHQQMSVEDMRQVAADLAPAIEPVVAAIVQMELDDPDGLAAGKSHATETEGG